VSARSSRPLAPHRPTAKDAFADEAKRAASARFNATLRVGYFIVGVCAAGLAAGPMTGFDADGINAECFGDGRYTVLAVVNIGKPGAGAWFGRAPRLDYKEAVSSV
jgi:3-hydroxypropanoate dehydrogenase